MSDQEWLASSEDDMEQILQDEEAGEYGEALDEIAEDFGRPKKKARGEPDDVVPVPAQEWKIRQESLGFLEDSDSDEEEEEEDPHVNLADLEEEMDFRQRNMTEDFVGLFLVNGGGADAIPALKETIAEMVREGKIFVEAPPAPPPAKTREEILKEEDERYDCWGCAWGDRGFNRVSAPVIAELMQMIDRNILTMEPDELAGVVRRFWVAKILEPAEKRGDPNPPQWPRSKIKKHLEEHMNEVRVVLGRLVNTYISMAADMENRVMVQDPGNPNKRLTDAKALQNFNSVVDRIVRLVFQTPEKSYLYNKNYDIDWESITRHVKNLEWKVRDQNLEDE